VDESPNAAIEITKVRNIISLSSVNLRSLYPIQDEHKQNNTALS